MNPYDFVPIVEDKPPQRCSPYGHDKFQGKSGLMECKITTLKPLFIPLPMDERDRQRQGLRELIGHDREGRPQYHNKYILNTADGIPVIPGSSIKGVIRSIAEAVGNSCITFFKKDKNKNYKTYPSQKFDPAKGKPVTIYPQFTLPDGFYPCTDVNNLCITCQLFGFQSSKGSFQGKINISDAKARDGYKVLNWIRLTELSSPKPHHKAFYASSSDPNKIIGRKFYFHHKPDAPILISDSKTNRNSTVRPIENAVFDFKVTFTNLTDDEYILLLYTLFLEDGVSHKIGYGKSAGLGSVKIEPLKLTLFDIEKRYRGFTTDDKEKKSDEQLKRYVEEQTKVYREDKSDNLKSLRRIWIWPGCYTIRYPDLAWFRENQSSPISKTL